MRSVVFLLLALFYWDSSASRIRIKRRCSYDSDCEVNSYCRVQTECDCKDGYYLYMDPNTNDEACLKGLLELGEECIANYQCQMKLGTVAECSTARICQCRQGAHYLSSTGRCYNTSKIGESCLTSDYCHINQPGILVTCDRGVCVCPRGQHPSRHGSRCIVSVSLGEKCTSTEQCVTTNNICYEECRCDVHHIENANRTLCLPEAERVGDACIESAQCSKSLPHSGCIQNLCQCLEHYHPGAQGHICWKTAYIGEPCENDDECIPTSVWNFNVNLDWAKCIRNVCTCAEGTTVDNTGSCKENTASQFSSQALIILLTVVAVETLHRRLC